MKSRIGYKLVIALLLFSSLITLITTALQLYFDYRIDIKRVENYEILIRESYLKSITTSVWLYNDKQIQTQLHGILHLPDMEHIQIHSDEGTDWSAGTVSSKNQLTKEFPLLYEYKGKMINIGALTAVVSLDNIYMRLFKKAFTLLFSNAIKTVLVSGFMLLIFQYLVTRHLYSLSGWLKNLDIGRSFEKFHLDRVIGKSKKEDELDEVVIAINEMQNNFKKQFTDLIKSEENYRSLFENAFEGLFQSTPEGRFISVNPSFARMLGYASPEELVSSISDIATQYYANPEDRHRYRQLLQKDGFVEHFEFTAQCKDGSHIWVSDSTRVIYDRDGKIARYEGNVTDITERKQAEEALRESEHKLSTHLQNTSVGAISWDMDYKIVEWNPAAETIFGYTKEEALGKHSVGLLLPEGLRGFVEGIFQDLLSGKGGSRNINENITKDGRRIICDWYNTVLKDADGKVIGMTALVNDITERMQTEEALQKSEKQYRTLFEKINDAIFIVEKDTGRYLDANKAAVELTGRTLEELKQLTVHDITPEGADQRLLTIAEADGIKELGAVTYSRPDNTHRIAMLSSVPLGDNAVIGIARDITHDLEVERQLRQSQKMESIGTLAGGIAHDFNNILSPIIGYSEIILMDTPEDSPDREGLNQIYTSALRARSLVKQILTFARQGSGELMLMKMQPIVKEALKLIRSSIPTTIEIIQDINPDCGVIKADPTQIHQIVMNLTTNAYHAMEETGGELKVSLKQIKLGEYDIINSDMIPGVYVCLTVADTGVGMDKSLTDKIFDPFFTTKAIGKGTGMGLSVVHGIVTAMGGAINVYSEPGKGTEFHVYLPVEKTFSEEQATTSKAQIQGGTEQILLVDDEEAILSMEKRMLERLGYKVTSRTSSLEVLEAFRASPDKFDLVITDMAMPNMPGDKLSVELTKIRPDIPILLCTGFSETMSEEKAASLGIKGFILKPIVMKDLDQKIREVLDKN